MRALEDFFRDLDGRWRWPVRARIRLPIIGSTALMPQTDYQRGTKDSDVLETADLTDEARLLTIAGKKSPLFDRHRLYLEIVVPGLPFLPQGPALHPIPALNADLAFSRAGSSW